MKNNTSSVSVEIIKKLDVLSVQRENFENNELRGSNKKLYDILSEVYSIFNEIEIDDKKSKKSTFEEMKSILKERGVKVQKNSPPLTILIRYVFNSDRVRSYNYNRVIQYAIKNNVAPEKLQDYIEECGGVEECKKKATKKDETIKKEEELKGQIQLVRENIQNFKPIFSVQVDEKGIEPQPECELVFCVGRKSPDGSTIEFFHVVKSMNKVMEKQAWKLMNSELSEVINNSESKTKEILEEVMN